MDLANLGYFKHEATTLFGTPVRLARGGYSAERGYEVFSTAADAHKMWDSILAAGKDKGVIPVSWACLDIVRVEGGLLFFPYEMPHGDTTPWEVKADWTVDLSKPDFIGKKALEEKKGKERSFVTGLEVDHTKAHRAGREDHRKRQGSRRRHQHDLQQAPHEIAGDGANRSCLHQARHRTRRSRQG